MNRRDLTDTLKTNETEIPGKILSKQHSVKEKTISAEKRHNPRIIRIYGKDMGTICKRRISFYSYISRMSPESMIKRIFTYFRGKKINEVRFTVVGRDLQEAGIEHRYIQNRDPLMTKLEIHQSLR